MAQYKKGTFWYVATDMLGRKGIDIQNYNEYNINGYFQVELNHIVRGRTWEVTLGWGQKVNIASRNFKQLLQQGPGRVARPQKHTMRQEEDQVEYDDIDCKVSSVGTDAEERRLGCAPSKRRAEEEWVKCEILTDSRDEQGIPKRRPGLAKRLDLMEEPIYGLFARFFPLSFFTNRLADVAEHYNAPATSRHAVSWDKGTFLRFIGTLIWMTAEPLPQLMWHFSWPDHLPTGRAPSTMLSEYMLSTVWKCYWRYCALPGYLGAAEETDEPTSSTGVLLEQAKNLLSVCVQTWQAAWNPGTYLVPDESMVAWTGKGDVQLKYIPRKPRSVGIKFYTMCCGESTVLLNAEVEEGKQSHAAKKWCDQVQYTTATTLRLVEPYSGSKRTVVADRWFGSCNTLEWLWDELHLHSILAVKTSSAGYCKQQMRDELGEERGSQIFFKIDVELERETMTYYAGGHRDKKPMLLVATCGTNQPGNVALRRSRSVEANTSASYELPQPMMHATYRRYFNAVDLFNRDCFGPQSVQFALKTKSWYRRFFLAILGMCETNALKAYRAEVGPIERYTWLCKLAEVLINNPWATTEAAGLELSQDTTLPACANLKYINHCVKCILCGKLTHWYCGCGVGICNPGTSEKNPRGPCYFLHVREKFSSDIRPSQQG